MILLTFKGEFACCVQPPGRQAYNTCPATDVYDCAASVGTEAWQSTFDGAETAIEVCVHLRVDFFVAAIIIR